MTAVTVQCTCDTEQQRCGWRDCQSLNVLNTQNWDTWLRCRARYNLSGKINKERSTYVKVKVKVTLEQATKAQRGE